MGVADLYDLALGAVFSLPKWFVLGSVIPLLACLVPLGCGAFLARRAPLAAVFYGRAQAE